MKQYCRYCLHCVHGDVFWCDEKERELAESTTKVVNKCKLFEFCQIDAIGLAHLYHARGVPRMKYDVKEEYVQTEMKL